MKTTKLLATALGGVIIAAALAACGGGGGGGSSSGNTAPSTGSETTPNPDGSWLTFAPSNINLSIYEGESPNFTVVATASKTFSQIFNTAIIDPVGVIVANATSVQQNTPYQYAVTMRVDPSLKIGPHTTNLEVRLCQDDPAVCKSPFPGSPWHVPVSVTVKAGTNLTSLHALPQVPAWSNTQGNAAHTAAVPASFNPASFTRRWDSKVPGLSSVVIDNSLIFGIIAPSDGGNRKLVALSEQSGQEVWHADLGNTAAGPVTTNGKVIITARSPTPADSQSYLMIFDQKTGAQIGKTEIAGLGVPVVLGDAIYVSSGFRLYKFSALTYKLLATAYIDYPFVPAPAADASYVYVQAYDTLNVLNASDLSTAYTISYHSGSPTVPVLTDRQVLYTPRSDNSTVYDLAGRSASPWGVTNGGISYANGVVYSIQKDNGLFKLNAIAVKGGNSWSSDWLPNKLQFNFASIVATDNLVFIGADSATLAIDLKTHAIVWTYPFGGELALSNNGMLYVLGKDGRLGAINLQ